MGYLTRENLLKIGFKKIGKDVLISEKSSFYSPGTISIGSNVRIDDFCILSGNIAIGNYIHISAYSALFGKGGIEMEDFSGLSPRCTLLSASDDFSGHHMISPMVPKEFTNVENGKIKIGQYAQIGAGTVILPKVKISEGTVIGAMSLVKDNTQPWKIYAGIPVQFIKERKMDIKEISMQFLKKIQD